MAIRVLIILGTSLLMIVLASVIFFSCSPTGRAIYNDWRYSMEKVDEGTYENQKEVEDTCRAMIASYNQDKLIYEQYKDSDIDEERSWANSAKIRANSTASTYNNYILENSFVWEDNVPKDIATELPYLE